MAAMRLAADECRGRLARARRAVLATVAPDGSPHVVPITFAVQDDVIVTAVDQKPKTTTVLQRLRNVSQDPRVAVLADHYAEEWADLWWARADGTAEVVVDGPARDVALAGLAERYEQYRRDPPRGPVIRIVVHRWTGWSAR
jgi:PPOX class probable F420-dependent enzyme